MSDTPRTDLMAASGTWNAVDLCRQLERENAELRKTLRSLRATFDTIHDRHYDNMDCDEGASGHRTPNRDMNTVTDCTVALDEIERVEPKSPPAQEPK